MARTISFVMYETLKLKLSLYSLGSTLSGHLWHPQSIIRNISQFFVSAIYPKEVISSLNNFVIYIIFGNNHIMEDYSAANVPHDPQRSCSWRMPKQALSLQGPWAILGAA
jgi:hypothetical protein